MAKRQTKEETKKEIPVEEVMTPEQEEVIPEPTKPKRRRIAEMDLNELISVESRKYGNLHYRSKEGYTCNWSGYGDVQPVPLGELLKMRNQAPRFFQDKWIAFPSCENDTQKVIDFLQVGKYYDEIVEVEDIEGVLLLSLDEVEDILRKADATLLDSIARCAHKMHSEGTLFDLRIISAVEKATGVNIISNGDE